MMQRTVESIKQFGVLVPGIAGPLPDGRPQGRTVYKGNGTFYEDTEAKNRLAEIHVLKTHIVNYSKTRDVYAAYRKSGYSKKLLEEYEDDIIIHKSFSQY